MTEIEWDHCRAWRPMYEAVREAATTRQARLLMAACCRLLSDHFFDPRIATTVAASEQCADDADAEAIAEAVGVAMASATGLPIPQTDAGREVACAIDGASRLLERWRWGAAGEYEGAEHALAHAAYLALRDRPLMAFTGGAGDAVEYCAWAIEWAGPTDISKRIAGVLRDLFGNPFRPAVSCSRGRTAGVQAVAQSIYDDRAFVRLPVLFDALMVAGCDSDDILDHCRSAGPHVRGCWVVDWVLSRA